MTSVLTTLDDHAACADGPVLLVVSGLPASGKTHLATSLAEALRWPLATKDEYKQILYDHLPNVTRAQAGPLSFSLMWHVTSVILAAGASVIVETHFYRPQSEVHLRDLTRTHQARLAQVFCEAPLSELKRRHAARVASGNRPHIDQPFDHEALPPEACWAPLALDAPLLRLDTTRSDGFDVALAWTKRHLILE